MKVKLVCDDSLRESTIEELQKKGIEISEDAEFVLYQKDYNNASYIPSQDERGNISLSKYTDIMYFEAIDKITYTETVNGRYIVKEKLYELDERLAVHNFLRVSKSYIVNIDFIKNIIPWIGSKFVIEMNNGEKIDVTRSYFNGFKKRLGI